MADSYSAPSQSFKTSADAIPLLKSSKFHHYMDPTTATSEELLKNRNDILFGNVSNPAKLKVNNLLWILVHGSENGIYDSYHPAVDPAAGLMTNSEIVLAALANRTKPVFNFIALYNCKSFEANFWASLLDDGLPAGVGRAGLVFDGELATVTSLHAGPLDAQGLLDNRNGGIVDHSNTVLLQLEQGLTFAEAVQFANTALPIWRLDRETGNFVKTAGMDVVGDPLARLRYVYLTQSDRDYLSQNEGEINIWYFYR